MPPPTTSEEASQNPLPAYEFEQLIPSLIRVLKAVNDKLPADEERIAQQKYAIAGATNELKSLISRAKSLVDSLPGGDMQLEDQDEVIKALRQVRDEKQKYLELFSQQLQNTHAK
ncbi:hypothetical protein FRC03_010106 [Tulasnella sp. 419]|nr:hypothetical protein FRC02_000021 [Tulasnella sp. 418]KAG8967361.1 hypothetical protein FRC03_010106 [Tulasnella sp. 419]